jgi:plastocyanin
VKSLFSNRALVSLVAALGLVMVSMATGAAAGAAKPVTHTVTIEGASFAPAQLTVTVGDSIVWVNKDPYAHTATSEAGGFDSGEIAPGKSWKYTAKKAGDFPYACTIHPSMKGTLHVK